MKRWFFLTMTLFLMAGVHSQTTAQSAKPTAGAASINPQDEIRVAERKWLDALYRLDAATLDALESDEFTLIAPPAVSTKQEHLAVVRERLQAADKLGLAEPLTKYSVTRHTIRIYGTTALVTNLQSVDDSGQNPPITSPGNYWQTELWHKEQGTWKLVHLHMTPVAHHKM
jgi:ketosteroid isomerase-like protein